MVRVLSLVLWRFDVSLTQWCGWWYVSHLPGVFAKTSLQQISYFHQVEPRAFSLCEVVRC